MQAKHLYLGWGNPKSAVVLSGVIVLNDKGKTRVIFGDAARNAVARFSDLSHHLCGVRHSAEVSALLVKVGAHPHNLNAYDHIFQDLWNAAIPTD